MQSVYRIDLIPAYKPWSGGQTILTTSKVFFDLFPEETWLPDLDYGELPEELRASAEEEYYDEEGNSAPRPSDIEPEYCFYRLMDAISSEEIQKPYILLDDVKIYTE